MNAAPLLARRYAQAFLDTFGNELKNEDMDLFEQAAAFFEEHRPALYFLSIPTIKERKKMEIMGSAFAQLNLPESCNALISLLIMQKRASLWPEVLRDIVQLYQKQHHIMHVRIESAPELSKPALSMVQKFLADKTGNDIIYTYRVNPELIAGIRVQSDTLLWEYSIAKKLRTIRLSLMQ